MANNETQAAWRYHDATKHSYWSVRMNAHDLDWGNQPFPFKVYSELEPIPLPRKLPQTGVPAMEAIWTRQVADSSLADAQAETMPELPLLADLLFYSAGITKKKTYPDEEIHFRAAACAGALYPIELYVVCADLPYLQAGVYHFSPMDFALRQLRSGDYRWVLARATADEPSVSHAPLTLVYTAITWRSSWKYQARSYRYHYWDCGMILANTMAVAKANRLPHKVVLGFNDDEVNHLAGVDGEHEMSLALVPIGRVRSPLQPFITKGLLAVRELQLKARPLSREEADYPIIREMHVASKLENPEEITGWRSQPMESSIAEPQGKLFPLNPVDAQSLPNESVESVIRRRGSTRRFARKPITVEQLTAMLQCATSGFPTDFLPAGRQLNDLYINVHAVDHLPAGAYLFHPDKSSLELVMKGDFRQNSSYLCLEQDLGGDSSATAFFLADLNRILAHYGNRGYRAAQLEAGIIGGRLYLAAYALGRGATGLTFYDDDVTEFFSPHAAGKSAIFVMALGVPAGRPLY